MLSLMKKITISIALLILSTATFMRNYLSNSVGEYLKQNVQVTAIITELCDSYGHEFKLTTNEIENILYGKWLVEDTIGYSLKYDITGGSLDYAEIEISKDQLCIKFSEKTFSDPFSKVYSNIVFVYYQETLNNMKQDDYLDDYSGIEDLDPDTMGTIVSVIGAPIGSSNKYEAITTKFIIINDNIVAVRQSTFYNLLKID